MATLQTPWGAAETVEEVAPGIIFVSTCSHGGYHLTRELNERVPPAWRLASFNHRALQGWYEEDVDACMVPLAFPEHFPAPALPRAQACFDRCIAPKLAKARAV
jgi:uncharacterized protein DUF7007